MKSEILRLLKENKGYLSGQQLCDHFQVSRTAVWKVIDQLKKEGYRIEAVRNKGYRLTGSPDVMSKAGQACGLLSGNGFHQYPCQRRR